MEDYYAFLWLEMENVEKSLSVERMSFRCLEAGRQRAERFLASTAMAERIRGLGSAARTAAVPA